MLIELGKELKQGREAKGVSLDAIAGPAKISAAYLHKLERGVVNNPSPRVLARIAAVLKIPYLRLMELAGYLDEEQLAEIQVRGSSLHPHPLAGQQLTTEDWQAVGDYMSKLAGKRRPAEPAKE
jgi:transcriptional regulator with XRE-family HTH domain